MRAEEDKKVLCPLAYSLHLHLRPFVKDAELNQSLRGILLRSIEFRSPFTICQNQFSLSETGGSKSSKPYLAASSASELHSLSTFDVSAPRSIRSLATST